MANESQNIVTQVTLDTASAKQELDRLTENVGKYGVASKDAFSGKEVKDYDAILQQLLVKQTNQQQVVRDVTASYRELNSTVESGGKVNKKVVDEITSDLGREKQALRDIQKEIAATEKEMKSLNSTTESHSNIISGVRSSWGQMVFVLAAVYGGVKQLGAIINSTSSTTEDWKRMTETAHAAYQALLRTIANGDWSNLHKNIQNATQATLAYTNAELVLQDVQRGLSIKMAHAKTEYMQQMLEARKEMLRGDKENAEKISFNALQAFNSVFKEEKHNAERQWEEEIKLAANKSNLLQSTVLFFVSDTDEKRIKLEKEYLDRYNALLNQRHTIAAPQGGVTFIRDYPDQESIMKELEKEFGATTSRMGNNYVKYMKELNGEDIERLIKAKNNLEVITQSEISQTQKGESLNVRAGVQLDKLNTDKVESSKKTDEQILKDYLKLCDEQVKYWTQAQWDELMILGGMTEEKKKLYVEYLKDQQRVNKDQENEDDIILNYGKDEYERYLKWKSDSNKSYYEYLKHLRLEDKKLAEDIDKWESHINNEAAKKDKKSWESFEKNAAKSISYIQGLENSFYEYKNSLSQTARENEIAAAGDNQDKIKEINNRYGKIEKDRAYQQAWINGLLGATKALASSAPPWNFIDAAAVLASSLIYAAEIDQKNVSNFAKGVKKVPLGGNKRGVDTVPANLTENERVVDVDKNKKYWDVYEAIDTGEYKRILNVPEIRKELFKEIATKKDNNDRALNKIQIEALVDSYQLERKLKDIIYTSIDNTDRIIEILARRHKVR